MKYFVDIQQRKLSSLLNNKCLCYCGRSCCKMNGIVMGIKLGNAKTVSHLPVHFQKL